jgi:hypothetical protein
MNATLKDAAIVDSSSTPVRSRLLKRKCACCIHTLAGRECAEFSKKTQTLQRASLSPRGSGIKGGSDVSLIVHEVLCSPSQPFDPETRSFFELRFGHDFSRLRVNTFPEASHAAETVPGGSIR